MRAIDADHVTSMLHEYVKREQSYIDIGNNRSVATGHRNGLLEAIAQIAEEPTIEPQRMKGRWETDAYGAMDDGEYLVTRCNVCGTVYEYGHNDRYCGFCGAAMEVQNETS